MVEVVLEKVSRSFGDVVAVDAVDLAVRRGEFVTLLGASGCGKTTTLRMVAGLERATSGRISIDGEIVEDAERNIHVPAERRRLGMVFQSYAIWPHMSVFGNVAYPLQIRRRPKAEIATKVAAALRLVEMDRFADRPATALSGGQQQRVAIARALVFEPAVLLLDEPLSNLDARLRAQTGDEFRALQKRLNIATLYVTHDQSEAMSLSDRVVVMHGGRALQIGPPEDRYCRPANAAVASFFGAPNLLPVRVTACAGAGDVFRLSLDGGTWSGGGRAARSYAVGEPALAIVRPENIRWGAAPTGAAAWEGRVQASVFRGATRSLEITTAGGPLRVEAPALDSFAVGAQTQFWAAEAGVWVVPPDHASGS